jgi:hypothetical protein
MKTKLTAVISALAVTFLALMIANTVIAQDSRAPDSRIGSSQVGGGVIDATPITPEEAAKKYPPPKGGGYPKGDRDPHASGQRSTSIITSPYPPHQAYECSKVAHGGLVLDTRVKKVFVRP